MPSTGRSEKPDRHRRDAFRLAELTDGGFRDSAEIARLAIPAYHHRPSAPTNLTLHQAIDLNVPIGCGDAPVFPGDVIVGDADGVVVLPAHLADELADQRAAPRRPGGRPGRGRVGLRQQVERGEAFGRAVAPYLLYD